MSKHTQGPWIVEAPYLSEVQTMDRLSVASCWYAECEGKSITVSGVIDCSVEESAANARLIAAAPELLEAAIAFVAPFDGIEVVQDGDIAKARAAIAKATAP